MPEANEQAILYEIDMELDKLPAYLRDAALSSGEEGGQIHRPGEYAINFKRIGDRHVKFTSVSNKILELLKKQ